MTTAVGPVTITLSGAGTYIFRPGGTLITLANVNIVLTNGASACDVFWAPVGATTIGADNNFVGTVIGSPAITIGNNVNWIGRALNNGASNSVTFSVWNATITTPTCAAPLATLNVVKQVVNSGGGVSVASDFTLYVKSGAVNVLWSPASGTIGSGISYSLVAGTYIVSEDINPLYTQSFSGDCNGSGSVTLASSDNKTCIITNTYTPIPVVPALLHVIKLVVNGSGWTAVASDFNIYVKSGAVNVLWSPASGTISPGTSYSLAPGTYVVSEDANSWYTQAFVGDCSLTGSITLAAADEKICTIINTNIPILPTPVIWGGGGGWPWSSYNPNPVPSIGILKVPTPLNISWTSGSVIYNYTVWNVLWQQSLKTVTVVDDKCSSVIYLTGDINNNSKIDTTEVWKYSCATTLTWTTTNTVTATAYSENDIITVATAIATVVVWQPVTPPLISVIKTPSRTTPFPYGGGNVKYSYVVTNPGTVTMSNISVTDDKCPSVSYITGDINNNKLLEKTEHWTYTCYSKISVSTTNIATARWKANDIWAVAYAFSTVLVWAPAISSGTEVTLHNAPGFPNAGMYSGNRYEWNVAMKIVIISIVLAAGLMIVKKYKTAKKKK